MGRKEWLEFCKIDKAKAYFWYNKVTKKRVSKEFESDPRTDKDAKVIHHLRDTEEQRKYNDEHYELFGIEIDENGNEHFEYGKYVVFWTKEHHNKYHHGSEETRRRLRESLKLVFSTDEQKSKRSAQRRSEWNEERRHKYSIMFSGENNCNYGKKASDELRKRLSESHKGIKPSKETRLKRSNSMKEYHRTNKCTQETRDKISKAVSGENNPNYGRTYSEYEKKHFRYKSKVSRDAVKILYSVYKRYDGILQWNDFQSAIKKGDIAFEEFVSSVYINIFKSKQQDIDIPKKIPFKVTKDKAAMYKLYKRHGGELKWNDFQSAYNKGEIHLNLINTSSEPVQIKTGDKLVQFMYLPIAHGDYIEITDDEFNSVPQTARWTGGFGSSGTK